METETWNVPAEHMKVARNTSCPSLPQRWKRNGRCQSGLPILAASVREDIFLPVSFLRRSLSPRKTCLPWRHLSRPRTFFQRSELGRNSPLDRESPPRRRRNFVVSAASVRIWVPNRCGQGLCRLETALPVCLESALGGTGEASVFDSRRLAYTRFFLRRKLAVGAVRQRFAGERHPVERCHWTASWRTSSFPSATLAVSRPGPSAAESEFHKPRRFPHHRLLGRRLFRHR